MRNGALHSWRRRNRILAERRLSCGRDSWMWSCQTSALASPGSSTRVEPTRPAASPRAPWLYWMIRGLVGEGRSWLEQALAVPGGSATQRARTIGITGFLAANRAAHSFLPLFDEAMTCQGCQRPRGGGIAALCARRYARRSNRSCRRKGDSDIGSRKARTNRRSGPGYDDPRQSRDDGSPGRRSRRGQSVFGNGAQTRPLVELRSRHCLRAQRIKSHFATARRFRPSQRDASESLATAWRIQERFGLAYVLLEAGSIAATGGFAERAALIWAGAEALRETSGLPRDPVPAHAVGVNYDPLIAKVKSDLGSEWFGRDMVEGSVSSALRDRR